MRGALIPNAWSREGFGGPASRPRQRTISGGTISQELRLDRGTTIDVIADTARGSQIILLLGNKGENHDNQTIPRPATKIEEPGAWSSSRRRAGRQLRSGTDRGIETDRTEEAAGTKAPDGAEGRRTHLGGPDGTKDTTREPTQIEADRALEDGDTDLADPRAGGAAQQRQPPGGQARTGPL